MTDLSTLIRRLECAHSLRLEDYQTLIEERTPQAAQQLREAAVRVRKAVYGTAVYVRGLIEISSYCKNDCLYCGIRRSNRLAQRYRLTPEEILSCCEEGYALGFRTFVLQGGEDPWFTDEVLCPLIAQIKARWPDCAVTLSLGERSDESYKALREAGADRYLLRHETATKSHYEALHPAELSFDNRMRCLQVLKELGYQVGCGFMVGSPHQTAQDLARDLKFVEQFRPAMCGIGPFIPHHDTPFANEPGGSVATRAARLEEKAYASANGRSTASARLSAAAAADEAASTDAAAAAKRSVFAFMAEIIPRPHHIRKPRRRPRRAYAFENAPMRNPRRVVSRAFTPLVCKCASLQTVSSQQSSTSTSFRRRRLALETGADR